MTTPDWRSILQESFDYDDFANRLWKREIVSTGLIEETKVFKHILAASHIWVVRTEGISLPQMPDIVMEEASLLDLHQRWKDAVGRFDYFDEITYANTQGEPYTRTFGDIARHVLNHGTYHRGQLRNIFGARGLEFPETDFILYSFMRDEAP